MNLGTCRVCGGSLAVGSPMRRIDAGPTGNGVHLGCIGKQSHERAMRAIREQSVKLSIIHGEHKRCREACDCTAADLVFWQNHSRIRNGQFLRVVNDDGTPIEEVEG